MHQNSSRAGWLATGCLLAAALPVAAHAESADEWKFDATLYAWLPSIDIDARRAAAGAEALALPPGQPRRRAGAGNRHRADRFQARLSRINAKHRHRPGGADVVSGDGQRTVPATAVRNCMVEIVATSPSPSPVSGS